MIVLLLPHQDDEFGAFGLIDRWTATGLDFLVVYLTDGAANGCLAETRNAESIKVLLALGVRRDRIWFLGQEQGSPDGHLVHNMSKIRRALIDYLPKRITAIYSPAWEGGHPDHDACAMLAVELSEVLHISSVFQFPLYNRYRCRTVAAVFNPILFAGKVTRRAVPFARRMKYLALLRHYGSQWRTFAGLGPLASAYMVRDGAQQLQRLTADVVASRPHPGPLLYEHRRWMTWNQFILAARAR